MIACTEHPSGGTVRLPGEGERCAWCFAAEQQEVGRRLGYDDARRNLERRAGELRELVADLGQTKVRRAAIKIAAEVIDQHVDYLGLCAHGATACTG